MFPAQGQPPSQTVPCRNSYTENQIETEFSVIIFRWLDAISILYTVQFFLLNIMVTAKEILIAYLKVNVDDLIGKKLGVHFQVMIGGSFNFNSLQPLKRTPTFTMLYESPRRYCAVTDLRAAEA